MATSIVGQGAVLSGRVALVTGAGRGIGQAIALALAEVGADLILLARSASELDETAARVQGLGREAFPVVADVSQREDVQWAVAAGLERFGRVDVLVNNAGVQPPIGPLVENDPEAWERAVAVNLFGPFHCIQAVLPGMIVRRRGKIINLSGGGATGPRPNFSAYAASKAAVVRLTETLAEEVRPYGIRVNAIAPGAVNTRMLDEVLAAGEAAGEELAAAQKRQAQGGTPAELAAKLVAFLASDASGDLTGKLISAPYDDWRTWDAQRIAELDNSPWYTLRRMDPHTLRPLMEQTK
jgi:NAD(P)-dependent dehydrogenase (short-subunit alcohol dehydrogenase family)